MRYSKARIIITTIISISCVLLVVFAMYKGIEFAKKANNSEEPSVSASITEKKKVVKKSETKKTNQTKNKIKKLAYKVSKKVSKKKTTTKKVTKKTTKVVKKAEKEVKKTETKQEVKKTETTNNTTKEEEKKQETPKQEVKKEEEKEVPTFDEDIVGKYVIKELTYEGKTYSKKDINRLIKEGYSMRLEIKKSGLAELSVLSINKTYAVDDTYFDDGINKVEYSHSNTRIRITVDNAKMLFVKE